MARRANGSGTLYRRNGWYYGQLKVGDGVMRKALDTRDKREAASIAARDSSRCSA